MKRKLLLSLLLLLTFAAGFASALFLAASTAAHQASYEKRYFHESIAGLRRGIYGSNYFHLDHPPGADERVAGFDPSKSTGSISLSYTGGFGGSDLHLELLGDGTLQSKDHGKTQFITTIPPDRCAPFFRRVLTSGILNYSEGVIELKKKLRSPNGWRTVTDMPSTEIRVSIPELEAEQTVEIYAPHVELENFPDIIEFQIFTQLEKEFLDLVPKDYPLWK